MARILITGGAGFIGRHLIKEIGSKKCEFIDKKCGVNLLDPSLNLKDYFKNLKPETIIHLAATSDVKAKKSEIEENNIEATERLLDLCEGIKSIKQIIFSSSSAVYGDTNQTNKETDELNPISYYGKSKVIGEQLIKTFCLENGINYKILRFGNVYGENGKGVINQWIQDIQKKKQITLYGAGNQVRDFIHVTNLVHYITKLIGIGGNVTLNLGTGHEVKLINIKKTLDKFFKSYKVNIKAQKKGDIMVSKLDIKKLKLLFGDYKTISLLEGVRGLI